MTTEQEFEDLTEEDITFIRDLRKRGFAVIVWTPYELRNCDIDLEDACIAYGNNYLMECDAEAGE